MSDFDYRCHSCGVQKTERVNDLPDGWWHLEARSGAPDYQLLDTYTCGASCLTTFMLAVAVMYGKQTNEYISALIDVIDEDPEDLYS